MVIGRLRRTLKRGMSIAMAAALMVTSVPQLSVSSMAQEEKNIVQEEGTDENISQEADQGETEKGKSQSEGSTENASTEEDREDSEETQKTSAEQSEEEHSSEDAGETEADTDAAEDDEKELEKDNEEDESETEEEEKKVSDSDKERAQEDEVEGKLIYENDFDSGTAGTSLASGTVVELADGNMAVEYDVDLSNSEAKWTDIFQAGFDLSPSYDEAIAQKMTMSFDVYFPETVSEIGTMKAKAVLKINDSWTWTEGSELVSYTAENLVSDGTEGYKKLHVTIDIDGGNDWVMGDIKSIKSVIPCLAGDVSTYKGKLYLDNVVLTDTSDPSGEDGDKEENKGKQIYENNFDSVTEGTELANGIVAKLADENMAIEYDVDLSNSEAKWTDIFQAGFDLSPSYDEAIAQKMTMSFDVYFPETVSEIGTMKAKAVLKINDSWTWTEGSELVSYTAENLVSDGTEGYKKLHITIDIDGGNDWVMGDIKSIKSVIPCLAGDVSTYKGKLYLDNVVLTDTSTSSGDNKPDKEEDIIYENDFDSETDASVVEEADNKIAELATLIDGNKAIKFTADLSESDGWADIFKAQINLPEEYTKAISEKVVMSYDVYFPESNIKDDFGTMKAQAVLKSGAEWTWITQQSWPSVSASELTDSGITGYKAFHVEIGMDTFKTTDGKDYPFEKVTPIKTVVPCLAGDGSKYVGDVYLDNLEVRAVNESGGELPPVEGDLDLELNASAWKVVDGYQYTGKSTIKNENISDKEFLVFNVDYSNDANKNWSEAKFDYTHPEAVATLQGYNAFKADIYYKPTDMSAGSFAIKLFSNIPAIDKDTVVPAGEPADIPGLEGYYKAEYVLNLRIPAGEFQNLTFGFVGKSTDYKGDIFLDNMRFTQVVEEDIYVDSTVKPVKGSGIQVVDDGRNIQTASGKKVTIAEEVALVDAKADEPTKNLYAYLKAVGESDSVIFGHQNDTHHKAGSAGDGFSNSDTKDITGSIAGVIGIDALSLTGNEASTWDAPESERIAKVVDITKEAAAEGALVTLSAHMPNFDVIDKRVKAYEESGKTGTDSDSVGYWEVNGEKQYNFSGYTPGTLTGNVVARVMPGQDLNYLYTDYLDLIADYAKAVEDDGITILFRPLHENTGSWFWWGAALCDEQAYIALYRYTVDYLKETKGVHNMIYVYGPGSEAANVTEYGARYPGDDYVDMIGYDLYHQMPSPENQEGYLQSIRKQNAILKEFATAHNKLYAITETGVADKNAEGEDVALQRTGNKVMDWYKQLLGEIADDGVCYFLVWANFSENGSFYLPYVVEKKENGVLHGHEMMDEFIEFYNDNRSVFATDMNSEFKKISGVTNTTEAGAVSGYIIAPQSGERLLTGNGNTRMVAMISGDVGEEKVQFIASAGDKKVVLEAELNEQRNVWEAFLSDEDLLSLGEIPGTIALNVGQKEIAVINARFNLKEPVQDDMVPEDFESYAGSNRELNSAWPTNKDSGSEIALTLTEEKDKVFGGKYGLQMDITLAKSDAWVGATKSFEADWSAGNALELYTIPETKGQKIVVQVKSGGEEFEVYLQEYEGYTKNAMTGTPVKVTIPFDTFIGKNNGKFDPSKIEVIGLWCNALPNENVTYPLSTTLYYDELRVVTTEQTAVQIEPYVDESVIYKNNFDSLESLEGVLSENVANQSPTLAEIAAGNKAVKYSANLSGKDWEDIFKAQFNLQAPYEKTISGKVVMSYDVYFPTSSVGDNFGAMKAQAALSCGSGWTWVSQKSWPEFKADGLTEDTNVPGYKKVHVEINMNDFETWDNEAGANKPYPFDKITPIQAVIPCFAGANSSYQGDLYLDNLVVMAVDESEDIPPVEGDLTLDLNAESWSVVDGYQYTGQSTIRNENVGDKTFLVLNMDYSNNSDKDWSEAKFDYTHPSSVDTLSGYNAFKVDLYYKPTDMTAGSFAIKVFSKSPNGDVELINKDAAVPVGEPVDIPGLEGYYKAEFVLDLKIPAGIFNGLTFGLVGKNTNFVGDIYLDNMRFTQVTASDIYVDSTIAPVKGPGIQIVDEGRSIQTASGNKVEIASEVALVDANANEAAKNLYAYLKAVGESDSVIFGHQNDTHHKAGSKGDGFSNSDTEDVTGSIAGVVGIDSLSLTGNEASTWDTPEAERIANVATITREAAAKGALITLSAHMPNFDVIDKRVKAYEAGSTGTDSDSVGYWDVNGDRQYNFSGYTPGTLTGNVVARIMPGQDLNYLYTDYLDLIADYAKAVEGDGITILFRPLHENTGSWFWWGAALCDEQAYINLYRYTVDYLKETKGVHNMLYVYGPGSEAANAAEYSARYPGDAYVDMIGYDLYHSNPSPENEAGYLQSISKQNEILKQFATAHNKLYAITETGVADKNAEGADVALQRTGNKVMDWYMQLLNEISDDGVSYFLVWANFSENGSFYLPYVTEKKENGVLHGHEMMDEFIKFYNDGRSVFATDMNSGFKQISGVTNTTKSDAVSGYITAPQSGDRILTDKENPNTRIAAKVSGVDSKTADIQFVVETEFDKITLKASYNEEQGVWEAILKDSALLSLGEAVGTISLYVDGEEIAKITIKFNMEIPVQNDMVPEDFEGYNGDNQQLGFAWATNKASGSEITLSLTDEENKVFGGKYGLKMDMVLAAADAWVGATKSFEADWSAGNALELYTIPETKGQKVVVQVKSSGEEFEVYLQEYEEYTSNAAKEFPVKVTIPFSAFVGKNNGKFDPARIEAIGLWCNALPNENVTYPLSTALYYDELRVVTTDQTTVQIEALAKEGVWIKEIPAQDYTGKAIKPEVQVYDYAKLLTPKIDYTVSYKNNINAGESAKVIIKGKGNYSEKIEKTFTINPKQLDQNSITYPEYLAFNNKQQKINVTVKDGNKKLSSKKDYTQVITYMDTEVTKAKDAGTYQIQITGKGNYVGEIILNCEMVTDKELLTKASVRLPSSSLDYSDAETGAVFDETKIQVKLAGKVIPQTEADGTVNYTVGYENNKEPGASAAVVIKAGADSKYVGSCRKSFKIKRVAFTAKTIDITGLEATVDYAGKAIFQNPVLKDKTENKELERNVDYSIAYRDNLNAGKATITFTGLGKYSGTIKKTYKISKVTLTKDMIASSTIEAEQNRAGAAPDVTITCKGMTLVRDRDYTLTYVNNKNITTDQKKAYISITGKGNYTGRLKNAVELQIHPKSWQSDDITIEVPDMKYSNKKKDYKPNPVVYDNGAKLVKGKDYTITYESNTKDDVGDLTQNPNGHIAKAIITVISSDYEDKDNAENNKRTVEFRIIGKLISEAKVGIKNVQYFSQKGTRPTKEDLTVTYKGASVSDDEYNIMSYSANDKKGKATLVIQGKGQYGGTKKITFTIKARGMESNFADAVKKLISTMIEQL